MILYKIWTNEKVLRGTHRRTLARECRHIVADSIRERTHLSANNRTRAMALHTKPPRHSATAESESSDEEDARDSDSHDGSSSSGSGGSDDDEEDNSESEASSSGEEEGDDEAKARELKRASVRRDIEEMQRMVGEMEKVKQRLHFRLEREKQVKLDEAMWQQQQLGNEEQQQRQQSEEEADRVQQQETRGAPGIDVHLAAMGPCVDIGVQTELGLSRVENLEHVGRIDTDPPSQPLASSATQKTSAVHSKLASIPVEDQSARLSLYDLGKSYGMKETGRSPARKEAHQQHSSIHHPPRSRLREANVPAPFETSESDTFFIRRDSNRTSRRVDAPAHSERFRQSQDSIEGSRFGNDNVDSPVSAQDRQGHHSSAFQTLRNSILSSVGEADVDARSASVGTAKKQYTRERSPLGSGLSSHFPHDEDDGGEGLSKTDEQREQEAIQSLLFDR